MRSFGQSHSFAWRDSHRRTSAQHLSFTALCMTITLVMSSSFGVQPLRLMALKNICSLGYCHVPVAAASFWCWGIDRLRSLIGMVDATLCVERLFL